MTDTTPTRVPPRKYRIAIALTIVTFLACIITWFIIYIALPVHTLRSAKADPTKPLTVKEYSRLKEYFESGVYKGLTGKNEIQDICVTAIKRAQYHNYNLYQFVLDQYDGEPNRWQILIPLSTKAITDQVSGAEFILRESRAIAQEPAIEALDLKLFIGHDVDIGLLISLFMSYDSSELAPHTELLKYVLDRDDMTPQFRILVRQKLLMEPAPEEGLQE